MKAIQIKYCGPTNTKGARLSVKAMDNKTIWHSYDHGSESMEKQAEIIAWEYINMMGWKASKIHVGTISNSECVAVIERDSK